MANAFDAGLSRLEAEQFEDWEASQEDDQDDQDESGLTHHDRQALADAADAAGPPPA